VDQAIVISVPGRHSREQLSAWRVHAERAQHHGSEPLGIVRVEGGGRPGHVAGYGIPGPSDTLPSPRDVRYGPSGSVHIRGGSHGQTVE
jgi:hypothetical protein